MEFLREAMDNFHQIIVENETEQTELLKLTHSYVKPDDFIKLNYDEHSITFKVQNGTIPENGINGLQVSDLIAYSLELIKALNKSYPCRENSLTITKLEEALHWQQHRTVERIKQGIEGKNMTYVGG